MGQIRDIKDLCNMLQNVSGPNSSGEYTAQCPGHDDRTASLNFREKISPKNGQRAIYINCKAGCPCEKILEPLGLTMKDLFLDGGADTGSRGRKTSGTSGRRAAAGKAKDGETVDPETGEIVNGLTVKQARETGPAQAPKPEEPKIDFAHPDKVYSYTDEDGKELFQVVRLHYKGGKSGKTFRQRMHAPGDPKANKAGYVNSVPAEIRDVTLYRLPQVIRAIAEEKPVYVVEGEKDVETLERLGHTATCNPGGAGKWRDGYSRRLQGADVIILPDNDGKGNDYTGQNHALDVALKLQGIARRVRLVDIKEACPELPEKGDISDMVQLMGDVDAMDALARQVAATGDFDPNAVPFWLTPMEQAEKLYGAVKGYGVAGGCICQETGNETKPLCDFVVLPRMEMEKNDQWNRLSLNNFKE